MALIHHRRVSNKTIDAERHAPLTRGRTLAFASLGRALSSAVMLKRRSKCLKTRTGCRSNAVVRVVLAVFALLAFANAAIVGWMFYHLGKSAGYGLPGESVATAERVKTMFPQHFRVVMAVMELGFSNQRAAQYYAEQAPLLAQAAAEFQLHPAFARTDVSDLSEDGVTWHNMIHRRIKAMAKSLREEGRDDFRVEKDRCAMFRFFQKNDFPICEVFGYYDTKDALVAALDSETAVPAARSADTAYPAFAKACHLTQSSSRGTFAITDADAMASPALREWVDSKWELRANDFDREWKEEGNELTGSLSPGFLIQAPLVQPGQPAYEVHSRISVGVYEFKVEVLWGRAYLALLDGIHVFKRDGSIEDYSTMGALVRIPGDGARVQWIVDEGYTQCVFDLAERVARTMAIDSVRMDIFLKKGDPSGCTVNENSLSSGMVYYGHEKYMAQAWADGHKARKFTTLDTTKPVYEMTEDDLLV